MPQAELKGTHYFVRVRNPKRFIKGSFRTQDVGRSGHTLRIAGRLKKSGAWATQAWRISEEDAHVSKGKLVGDNSMTKAILGTVPNAHLRVKSARRVKVRGYERRG